MKFAYHACMCPPDQYLPLAKAVEDAGFDTFTLPDSVIYPTESDTSYPYNGDGDRHFLENIPFIDPFSLIPAMAAVTTRLHFSTSVLKLAIRQPVVVAKSVSSVAVLSNNRFTFGVGISPWPEDFAACGIPWKKRGKRMDEMIDIIRGLMDGKPFSYDGEIFEIPEIKICPTPTESVPILVGGHSDLALKRAVLKGDGWISAGVTIDELQGYINKLNRYREEYNKLDEPFEVQTISGDAFSVEGVQRLESIGVSECIVGFRDVYASEPDNKSLQQKIDEINWYAENIIAPTNGSLVTSPITGKLQVG